MNKPAPGPTDEQYATAAKARARSFAKIEEGLRLLLKAMDNKEVCFAVEAMVKIAHGEGFMDGMKQGCLTTMEMIREKLA